MGFDRVKQNSLLPHPKIELGSFLKASGFATIFLVASCGLLQAAHPVCNGSAYPVFPGGCEGQHVETSNNNLNSFSRGLQLSPDQKVCISYQLTFAVALYAWRLSMCFLSLAGPRVGIHGGCPAGLMSASGSKGPRPIGDQFTARRQSAQNCSDHLTSLLARFAC